MKLNTNNANLLISAGRPNQFPAKVIPQVAISGRSNVGKSSLINTLLNRKSLARVSGTPGKTITVNFYNVDNKLMLVDMPGYGFAKRTFEDKKKWSELTDGYFTNNKNIDLLKCVIQLVDARIGPTKDDCDMLLFLRESGIPHLVVCTKIDKLNKTELTKFTEDIRNHPMTSLAEDIILFSSQTRAGKEDLWNSICGICEL
jgi:GTP-binding protein